MLHKRAAAHPRDSGAGHRATVMPLPTLAGVLGMARTTLPPADRVRARRCVRAGHDRDHQRRRPGERLERGAGLAERSAASPRSPACRPRRYPALRIEPDPCAASAPISGEGCGSITTTRLASRPPASHPISIAPPILPAPASAMVPWRFLKGVSAVTTGVDARNLSRRPCGTQGPITTGG